MVNAMHGWRPVLVAASAMAVLVGTYADVAAGVQSDKASLVGAWTLNAELSDHPTDAANGADGSRGGRGSHGGGGGGGHRRGGGYGGGYGGGHGGRGGGGQPQMDPETMQRVRDALRDITNPPGKIVITQTESMVVMTTPDGRTTRLSPDGKKIKDENTGIERKTKWDAGKLVTEISGPNGMKVTQTYAINPELHQLRLTTQIAGGRSGQARTVSTVYDADK